MWLSSQQSVPNASLPSSELSDCSGCECSASMWRERAVKGLDTVFSVDTRGQGQERVRKVEVSGEGARGRLVSTVSYQALEPQGLRFTWLRWGV